MQRFTYLLFFFIANQLGLLYAKDLIEIPQEHRLMIEHHPYRVLGAGHACMDLLIPINEEFLTLVPGKKGGAQPIGVECLNSILAACQTQPHLATGGSCANTLKGLASLGEHCAFLSRVGADALGEHFMQYMKSLGIVGLFSKSIRPTSQVLCLITPDGQRTMRFCAGCSEEMSENYLHSDYFKGIKLLHIEAYTMRNGNLVERLIQLAKETNAKISMDLSSFELIHQFRKPLTKILPHIDIVFANENETKALTGLEAFEGCFKLQEMCPIAVVLMGDQGCLVGHQGKVQHYPAFPAQVVDSTGAGDLFASGFLYGYLQNYPLAKCARIGNRLGSAIVEVQGAELPPEKWEVVRPILQEE